VTELKVSVMQGTMRLNVEMIPDNVKLDEVIVYDKRADETEISTIEISPDFLTQLPSLSGEIPIFKSLEMLPGINRQSELSSGLYVRGGSPDQTLTLLDGVIVYNPSHLGNFSSTFNSNALQNIKLIKGAFPAEYGGRLSSVLDIKLRSGTKEKDKQALGMGMLSSNIMLEGPMTKDLTYMISGRSMYYDFYQNQFNKNSSAPRYNFFDVNAKFTQNISDNNIISISGFYNEDKLYSPSNSADINYDIGWKNSTLSLNWLQINSASLLVNTIVSYIDYEFKSILNTNEESATSSNYFSVSNLKDFLININVESNINVDHKIKAGFNIALHDYTLTYSDYYSELLESDPNIGNDIVATETSMFLQSEWKPFEFLSTNFGGRFYYFKSKDFFKIEPRLSASISFNDALKFKLAYSTAHQFLHLIVRNDISLPTDLWYPSSKNIEPSLSKQYVAGFDTYWFDKFLNISVEGYYKRMYNLYEFKNAPTIQFRQSIEQQFTIGEGEAYGVELFINKRAGDLTGWIGYTLSWTKRKFEDLNAGRIFNPRYDRRHDVSIVLSYKLFEDFGAGLTWTYATGQGFTLPTGQYQFLGGNLNPQDVIQFNYTERNGYRLPSYHKLDLNFNYKFIFLELPFEAYLSLFNVYNRANPFAVYIDLKKDVNDPDKSTPVLKQLTLFPFIPTFGFNVKF
jgi:outer membrane cobalamin receptor